MHHPNVHAFGEQFGLLAVADAAVHHAHAQRAEPPERLERRVHLRGELTRRLDDERARVLVLGQGVEARENGQRKGRRFAGARLGGADHVAALEDERDGLLLDGRRLGKTGGADGQLGVVRKLEISKNHEDCIARRQEENPALQSLKSLSGGAFPVEDGAGL